MNPNSITASALRTLCASLLFIAAAAKADCGGTLDQANCLDVRTTLVYIDANEDAYITVSGNAGALPCTAPSGLLKLPKTAANFKAVYATLLAAHLASRPVNVRLAPIASVCSIVYVSVP
jgi:hypothetical protein